MHLQELKRKSPAELLNFAEDRNRHTARFFRIVNEAPTLLMIGVVLFVVVKPF